MLDLNQDLHIARTWPWAKLLSVSTAEGSVRKRACISITLIDFALLGAIYSWQTGIVRCRRLRLSRSEPWFGSLKWTDPACELGKPAPTTRSRTNMRTEDTGSFQSYQATRSGTGVSHLLKGSMPNASGLEFVWNCRRCIPSRLGWCCSSCRGGGGGRCHFRLLYTHSPPSLKQRLRDSKGISGTTAGIRHGSTKLAFLEMSSSWS